MNSQITQQAPSAWILATLFGFLTSVMTAYISCQTTSALQLQIYPHLIIAGSTFLLFTILFIPLALVDIYPGNQRIMNIALASLIFSFALPVILILDPLHPHIYLAVINALVGIAFLAAILILSAVKHPLRDKKMASVLISLAIANVVLQLLGNPLQSLSPTLSILMAIFSFWMWTKSLEIPQYKPQG